MADNPQEPYGAPRAQPLSHGAPIIVGIYGLSGCGKTYLLNQLRLELGQEHFRFFEGSDVIHHLVPGGLDSFKQLSDQEKVNWRKLAIDNIRTECIRDKRVGIVTGHYMIWNENERTGQVVLTDNDLQTYTHILYLDTPATLVGVRRITDSSRKRPYLSTAQLQEWQQAEMKGLRRACLQNAILFSQVSAKPPSSASRSHVSGLLRYFQQYNPEHNLLRAETELEKALQACGEYESLHTVLVLDGDRTLAAEDTGTVFWQAVAEKLQLPLQEEKIECPLRALFGGPLGYSDTAFIQAALMYEEVVDFNAICHHVASKVTMYPEFKTFLQQVKGKKEVTAIILTCGLKQVWENVLQKEGLSDTVRVIGGGRIADGLVITAEVKGSLVACLQKVHSLHVWAFGDSPLDLSMLTEADQAVVVVGEQRLRSQSMESALSKAVDGGLRACQILLPDDVPPRLNRNTLPVVTLDDQTILDSIFSYRPWKDRVRHITSRDTAKLLMTPMRNAHIAGPSLREAHSRVGWYLAMELLAEDIGMEEYAIPHVQGHHISGYRLAGEADTTIVALMRGGEPMALGVSDAFPLASFVHAKMPQDLRPEHLQGKSAVILVDSVVNSGQTVVQFVQHIRSLSPFVRVVVVAGVVQEDAIATGNFAKLLDDDAQLSVAALRISGNKFTGKGSTDTGHRLFNTTFLN